MKPDQKFSVQTIFDHQQNLPFIALKIPEKWQLTGEVSWRYENVQSPLIWRVRVFDPQTPEELTFFPRIPCYWLQGAAAFNRPGSVDLGQMNVQPMAPPQALGNAIVQFIRPKRTQMKLVGSRNLPGLAKLLKTDPKTVMGIGVKGEYVENGIPIEEEFHALYYYIPATYDGPQGRSTQINWGLDRVHSFKAVRGQLDQARDRFAFMVRSMEVNPAWTQRNQMVQNFLNEQFNAQLAQGYATIEAAGRLSQMISANNNAMIANMERQRAAAHVHHPAPAGRSPQDQFSDYIRGVDTVNDPYYGTSQHSNAQQYHWTDGYGSYLHSNDPGFDPNLASTISWQPMTSA